MNHRNDYPERKGVRRAADEGFEKAERGEKELMPLEITSRHQRVAFDNFPRSGQDSWPQPPELLRGYRAGQR